MGEVRAYPHGTFCWVDLATTDPARARAFHSAMLGWEVEDPDPTGYAIARVDGKDVAAIFEMSAEERETAPPHWHSSVSVDDVDRAVAVAGELGAEVTTEPRDVGDRGRAAAFLDPSGAGLNLWQPGSHAGARLVNEPGTWTWCDLATRDPDRADRFYAELFGWSFEEVGPGYWTIAMGDLLIGGMRRMVDDPPEIPPHWLPYFVVEDADAAATRLQELGARVLAPPGDVPAGRFLAYVDPQGAAAALFEMTQGPARGVDTL